MRGLFAFLCVALLAAAATAAPVGSESTVAAAYRLGAGDKVRVTTFWRSVSDGEFEVSGAGAIALPLIGEVKAQGLTTTELQAAIATALRDGYVKDPKVSVQVLTYRPFYILGQVNKPGEYPYSAGLTVMNAVATGGGFTYRANTKHVRIRHLGDGAESDQPLTVVTPVAPGDTIRIRERYFLIAATATGGVQVWGVVNVTPDSFSDGGRYASTEAAVARGLKLIEQGAAVLDVGGESTRPGAQPVNGAEELRRVLPVVEALVAAGATISIDTLKPAVARAAVAAGASIWNDVTALGAPGALEAAADLGCGVVLMHMQGSPLTMQAKPAYTDVVSEVEAFLLARAEAAMAAGVAWDSIWLDPGIGFGKTLQHNLALLRALPRLASHGFPLLVGVSHKKSVQAIDPTAADPQDRLGGSLAFALWAAAHGAAAVRVHDVRETVQALKVQAALRID